MGLGLDNPVHLAIVLAVVLLLFGAKRVPEIGRSLGEGIRGFKDSITGAGETRALAEHTEALGDELDHRLGQRLRGVTGGTHDVNGITGTTTQLSGCVFAEKALCCTQLQLYSCVGFLICARGPPMETISEGQAASRQGVTV